MKPNIVWLTIDSVRADHCSVNSYHRDTTPILDSIANAPNAGIFENCFSHGIWSLESAASILSGTYPSYHRTGGEDDALPADLYTIPERFTDAGYETIGISANPWFGTEFGLDHGFQSFIKANKQHITNAGCVNTLKYLLRIRSEGGGFTRRKNAHKSEYISRNIITNQLEQRNEEKPVFLYAHTEGVHTPYFPPGRTLGAFSDDLDVDPRTARETAYRINDRIYEHVANGLDISDRDLHILETMYDELLRYADHQLRYILKAIEGLDRPTVLVVTSDHGDLLGEQDLLYHMLSLHDGLAHVPCVILGLDHLGLNSEITNGLTQHIDIMKTILAAVGGPTDELHGYDLREDSREYAVIQRSQDAYDTSLSKLTEKNPSPDLPLNLFPDGFATAIRSPSHKYITDADTEILHAFPDETSDITDSHPDVLAALKHEYERVHDEYSRDESAAGAAADVPSEVEDRLAQLGYK